jgi:hypothetical protein
MAPEKARAASVFLIFAIAAFGIAGQKPKPKVVPQKHETRGTTQVAGGYVKFGEVYSLKNGVNFQILKAAYTMDNFPAYNQTSNAPEEKLVVFDIAVKNWMKDQDLDFNSAGGDFMVLFDAAGHKYTGEAELKSNGTKEMYVTLKPGQGLGQPALNDAYRVAFRVPLDAEITKVMVNQPRMGKSEEVLRYVLDRSDKEFDPANVIAPLPAEVRDPSGKGGAALKEGKGRIGLVMPAGPYTYEVLKVEPNVGPLSEKVTPEEGHHFVAVTLKITNVDLRDQTFFDGSPRESYVLDADGDRHPIVAVVKVSSDEEPSYDTMTPGASKTIRLLFDLPASAKPQSLTLAGSYYPWRLGLTEG